MSRMAFFIARFTGSRRRKKNQGATLDGVASVGSVVGRGPWLASNQGQLAA